jgi:hypothetical protein
VPGGVPAELRKERIAAQIECSFASGRNLMTERQVRAVRAVIDGHSRLINPRTAEFEWVLDGVPESMVK